MIENVKTVAEIAAYLSAAGFFSWKVIAGFFVVNASLELKTERSGADGDFDYLSIAATLKKGSTGSLLLHDVRARVAYGDRSEELELLGYERLSFMVYDRYLPEIVDIRARVNYLKQSRVSPYLIFSPEEQATFSGFTRVPKDQPCIVEVAVIGKRANHRRMGQWRSSSVSLPQPRTARA